MGTMNQIPDIMRRHRPQTSQPYQFLQINNLAVVVGVLRVPLAPNTIACTVIFLQADNGNQGIVCVGGQSVTVGNGLQLGAGQATLFASDQSLNAESVLRTAAGLGLMGYEAYQQPGRAGPRLDKIEVISLNHVNAIATQAAQTLRVTYITYIT